jgi:hypothetical protein
MTSSTQAINATLYPELPYDSIKDFAPVSLIASSPMIIAVYPALAVNNVQELISLAKAKPRQILYPSAGTWNATHLAGELFSAMAGVTLVHVPYKGAAPGMSDPSPQAAGRFRDRFGDGAYQGGQAARDCNNERCTFTVMPELPTVAESVFRVMRPARGPDCLRRLAHRVFVMRLHLPKKALAVTEVRERLAAAGAIPSAILRTISRTRAWKSRSGQKSSSYPNQARITAATR